MNYWIMKSRLEQTLKKAKYGDCVHSDKEVAYCGTIPFFDCVISRLMGSTTIHQWWGSDVLTCFYFPPGKSRIIIFLHRIKMFLLRPFTSEHLFFSQRLLNELPKIYRNDKTGIFYSELNTEKYKRISHAGFNILVYWPEQTKYNRWVYGCDIIEEFVEKYLGDLTKEFGFISIYWANGSLDMSKVYPYIDFYIRPTRHDGEPRMVLECKKNNIPYYYSEDGNPNIEKIRKMIYEETKIHRQIES